MIDLKMAFLNQLRKRLTDPAGRATTHTETFNGDGSATSFTLTNLGLMYVDSVNIFVFGSVDSFDAITGWSALFGLSNITLNTTDEQEGTGCLAAVLSTAAGFGGMEKTMSSAIDLTEIDVFKFWLYLEDGATKVNTAFLVFGNDSTDKWQIQFSGLVDGWNEVSLNVSDRTVGGGSPTLDNIAYYRLLVSSNTSASSKVIRFDDLRLGSGTSKTLISDYKIDFGTGAAGAKIKFSTPPANGTGNVSVTYFTGNNWIFDDYPRKDAAYPRIAMTNVGGSGESSGGVGDEIVLLKPSFRIGIYVRTGKNYTISGENYTGSKLLDYMITDLQNQIRNIRHNNEIGNLIDMSIGDPNYLGLDEEHKLKRCSCTVRVNYMKTY